MIMPNIDHNSFFARGDPAYFADQMAERPSRNIEVRIRLRQSSVSSELKTELRSVHNMTLSRPNLENDIVIISGIPPDNNFGRQEILEIVRRYAPRAVLA